MDSGSGFRELFAEDRQYLHCYWCGYSEIEHGSYARAYDGDCPSGRAFLAHTRYFPMGCMETGHG